MKSYKFVKALNHNVVQALNSANEEIIIFGKGIGFNCKVGDFIPSSLVDKEYYFRDSKNTDLYASLLAISDERLVTIIEQAISEAEEFFERKPNEKLRVALLDHLNFSIYRLEHKLNITNLFNDELEAMYEMEFTFARKLINTINSTMGINLPESEIGFITQHLHASLNTDKSSKSNLFMQIILNCLEYLEKEHALKYPKHSLEKVRLMTHLKFALKRANEKTELKNEFSPKILENYPKAYAIAKDLSKYIETNFGITFQESEIGYLALHIQMIQNS